MWLCVCVWIRAFVRQKLNHGGSAHPNVLVCYGPVRWGLGAAVFGIKGKDFIRFLTRNIFLAQFVSFVLNFYQHTGALNAEH